MCNAPVLSAPNLNLPFKLQIEASATGVGAVLLQEDASGVDHPGCYFSRKLSKCQQNYSTIEKETLALLLALQHLVVYTGGSSFVLFDRLIRLPYSQVAYTFFVCFDFNPLLKLKASYLFFFGGLFLLLSTLLLTAVK